jgi:UDP-GlcNAc:undecaprenyl-phosphate GlcNAc-1-phosphate transferase
MIYNFFIIIIICNIIFLLFYAKIVKLINIYDKGDNLRKFQKNPVPPLGGLIIISNISLFFFINYIFQFNLINSNYFFSNRDFLSFFFGCIFFYFLGLYDDKYNLRPNIKFIATLTLVISFIIFDQNLLIKNITFSFLPNIIELNNLSYFFTSLCILLFLNALNMFDGINLQVGSYVFFIFLIFVFKGVFINISLVIMIGLIFFLILNYKNKIYMGDSGVFLLAYIISYIVIKSYNYNLIFYVDEIFVIMLLPGVDMFRLFLLRVIRGSNPFKADRNHLHHLLSKYFNSTQSFLIIYFSILLIVILYYYINFLLLLFGFIIIYISSLILISKKK